MSTVFTGSVNIYMERQQNCLHFTDVETRDACSSCGMSRAGGSGTVANNPPRTRGSPTSDL